MQEPTSESASVSALAAAVATLSGAAGSPCVLAKISDHDLAAGTIYCTGESNG
jgi:hypothetical protein